MSRAATVRRPPRRWPLVAAGGFGAAWGLAGAVGGLGWYFSTRVLAVEHEITYPVRIRAVHGDRIVLSRDADTERRVHLGLTWPGGHALLSPEVSGRTARRVVRRVGRVVRGTLEPGPAFVTGFYHDGDPATAYGFDFRIVDVPGELGALPAWYVPPARAAAGGTGPAGSEGAGPVGPDGEEAGGLDGGGTGHARDGDAATPAGAGRTWVIAVHGRGASPAEALRMLPAPHQAGLPSLVISYRNDEGGPTSPDGFYHLGDSEWRDLAAAVRYARDHGATGVVLYGWSMGGAISLTALRRMAPGDARLVRGVVLDCPVIDWRGTLRYQAAQRHLPGALVTMAGRLTELRGGLSLGRLDQRAYAADLDVPVLLFVDLDDLMVAPEAALEYARLRPDLVTLVETTGGGHTRSWNVDPDGYTGRVAAFLDRVAGPAAAGRNTRPTQPVPKFAG